MNLTPKQVVDELNQYIIGQDEAKKAVAVALRNRYRRSKLSKEMRDEITPKNIIMKGPTGVGKTEIARRLAKLVKAPFIKIEATKYTEVGYVGRDVESMVRDLVETSVRMVKDEKQHEVEKKAKVTVDKILLDAIYKSELAKNPNSNADELKEKLKVLYDEGKLDEQTVEIEVQDVPKPLDLTSGVAEINIGSMLGGIFPQRKKRRKLSVLEARELLTNEECDKMIDMDSVNSEAIKRAEEEGIIFIDEIDKVIGKAATSNGPDVSREGVQRDILPIVEGSTVATKYGNVKTDFILFIASGAFHVSKIEDMIPELQGRFPIKVELKNLTKDDFYKILTETKTSVTTQYAELLKIDNIDLDFTDDALKEIAEIAEEENETNENIGARRLHSIIEKVLEDISFNATGENPLVKVVIDKNYVQNAFGEDRKKYDLKKYVL
ncbi:MAG: ATP-dependent protease ATPase subunit HslU [Firmicutes bacterium]|nr:ATP-dependent protease ATPase subunit HslU [Bacillota bacterium]MDY5585872.1 ATP-dependent protease ATPase subunit HslU [Eubacteriales bacterium]